MARVGQGAIVVGLGMLAGVARVAAQEPAPPIVTVAGFYLAPKSGVRDHDAAALTEALSVRLVESGRYRVLDRTWIDGPLDTKRPIAVAALRARARDAGVDYILAGRIERHVETYRFIERMTTGQGFQRPPAFGRHPRSGPALPRIVRRRVESTLVRAELTDVATGRILTAVTSRMPGDPRRDSRLVPLALAGASPLAAAAVAVTQARRASSASALDPALEHVVTEIAGALFRMNVESGATSPGGQVRRAP